MTPEEIETLLGVTSENVEQRILELLQHEKNALELQNTTLVYDTRTNAFIPVKKPVTKS